MPRLCASAFISSANFSIDPDTPSASTTAISFGECTSSIFNALSTVTSVPALNPILNGFCATAVGDTVNTLIIEEPEIADAIDRIDRAAARIERAQREK